MDNKKIIAIILAGGRGSRMNSDIPKQYLEINDKPIIYYTLEAFENSIVDEIVLVAGKDDIEFCQEEIVDRFDIRKVIKIIEGGKERYDSVYNGLKVCPEDTGIVLVHDGARPLIEVSDINKICKETKECGACVLGVPSKDTIKITDSKGIVVGTTERSNTWIIQTPQAFDFSMLKAAYEKMLEEYHENITDDSMVVETYTDNKIRIVEGNYTNIKLTTPEDLEVIRETINRRK